MFFLVPPQCILTASITRIEHRAGSFQRSVKLLPFGSNPQVPDFFQTLPGATPERVEHLGHFSVGTSLKSGLIFPRR